MGVILINLLLSIKNKYATQILLGHKIFEFRKSFPDREIDKIFLYVSYPKQKIIGYFTSEYVLEDTIENLKEVCYKEWETFDSGKDGFDDYFKAKAMGVAIKIDKVVVFDEPVNPFEFEDFKPPQSYYIMNEELNDFILRKLETKTNSLYLAQSGGDDYGI